MRPLPLIFGIVTFSVLVQGCATRAPQRPRRPQAPAERVYDSTRGGWEWQRDGRWINSPFSGAPAPRDASFLSHPQTKT